MNQTHEQYRTAQTEVRCVTMTASQNGGNEFLPLKPLSLTVFSLTVMSSVLLLQPSCLNENLLDNWPLWFLYCLVLISDRYFQMAEGNQWSKTFWEEDIPVLNNMPHRNKKYTNSATKTLQDQRFRFFFQISYF